MVHFSTFSSSLAIIGVALVHSVTLTEARSFTVVNKCKYTIWPGIFTGNTANGTPDGIAASGGWQLNAGAQSHFNVPDSWLAGRIWPRTECNFKKPDVSSCATGSCIGGMQCKQPGIPPVTLAEFTLSADGQDNYDISGVDGVNVPLGITPSNPSCSAPACHSDWLDCPQPLQAKVGNRVVGCRSACNAFGGSNNCCTPPNETAAKCPSSGVQSFDYFKNKCPDAYAYAYDEKRGVLKTCSGKPNYTITFCP